MAFGRGSTTVPSTVNASSFGLLRFSLLISALRGVREQDSRTERPQRLALRSAFYSTGNSEKRKNRPNFRGPPRVRWTRSPREILAGKRARSTVDPWNDAPQSFRGPLPRDTTVNRRRVGELNLIRG